MMFRTGNDLEQYSKTHGPLQSKELWKAVEASASFRAFVRALTKSVVSEAALNSRSPQGESLLGLSLVRDGTAIGTKFEQSLFWHLIKLGACPNAQSKPGESLGARAFSLMAEHGASVEDFRKLRACGVPLLQVDALTQRWVLTPPPSKGCQALYKLLREELEGSNSLLELASLQRITHPQHHSFIAQLQNTVLEQNVALGTISSKARM